MARPSQNTDQRLIQAAVDLIPETGFSGLSLRKVAQRAGVNLGMFPYHFKNKEAFRRRVLEELYESFYARLTLEAAKGGDPEEQLRQALTLVARYIRENRKLLLAIGRDILEQDMLIIRFVENNFFRHIKILLALIQKNRKSGHIQKDIALPMILVFFIANLAVPNLLAAVLERTPLGAKYGWLKKMFLPGVINDAAVSRRLDLIFKALAPSGGEMKPSRTRTVRRKGKTC
ncbi:MAG: TetR/AcrR family transcriptional regulator [Candidatus Firestonebacteria bacterium]|nr:TetR/AcrR family transcriptional regulator [Candidatus Firestonebacteria bacterium]